MRLQDVLVVWIDSGENAVVASAVGIADFECLRSLLYGSGR